MTLRINATHRHSDRGLDPYWTPDEATRALLEIERLPHVIWEPAAGAGAISKMLRSAGHKVTSSDIARYDDFDLNFSADYLTAPAPHGVQAIITNPPFRLALQFAAKAIADASYVALLLRLNFLESVERHYLLSQGPAREGLGLIAPASDDAPPGLGRAASVEQSLLCVVHLGARGGSGGNPLVRLEETVNFLPLLPEPAISEPRKRAFPFIEREPPPALCSRSTQFYRAKIARAVRQAYELGLRRRAPVQRAPRPANRSCSPSGFRGSQFLAHERSAQSRSADDHRRSAK
jgi:hypothetical protein